MATLHVTQTTGSLRQGGWWAVCSCGWRGPVRWNPNRADRDGLTHEVEADGRHTA